MITREAQLSQNVSLSHSRSLKVMENDTIRKLSYGFLFALHSNHGRTYSSFDTVRGRDRHRTHGDTDTARQHKPRLCICIYRAAKQKVFYSDREPDHPQHLIVSCSKVLPGFEMPWKCIRNFFGRLPVILFPGKQIDAKKTQPPWRR